MSNVSAIRRQLEIALKGPLLNISNDEMDTIVAQVSADDGQMDQFEQQEIVRILSSFETLIIDPRRTAQRLAWEFGLEKLTELYPPAKIRSLFSDVEYVRVFGLERFKKTFGENPRVPRGEMVNGMLFPLIPGTRMNWVRLPNQKESLGLSQIPNATYSWTPNGGVVVEIITPNGSKSREFVTPTAETSNTEHAHPLEEGTPGIGLKYIGFKEGKPWFNAFGKVVSMKGALDPQTPELPRVDPRWGQLVVSNDGKDFLYVGKFGALVTPRQMQASVFNVSIAGDNGPF